MNIGVNSVNILVPCRLKVLHELVKKFSGLGRYEVAIPLCRMALDEYEYSVGYENAMMAELQVILAKMYDNYTKTITTYRDLDKLKHAD